MNDEQRTVYYCVMVVIDDNREVGSKNFRILQVPAKQRMPHMVALQQS